AGLGGGSVAAGGAGGVPPARRKVPLPRVPGARHAARRAGGPGRHEPPALAAAPRARDRRDGAARAAWVRAQGPARAEQRALRQLSVLHRGGRAARARLAGGRPAARWGARADLLGVLRAVHDRAGDLRRGAVVVAPLPPASPAGGGSLLRPADRRAGARVRPLHTRPLPLRRLPRPAQPRA